MRKCDVGRGNHRYFERVKERKNTKNNTLAFKFCISREN